MKAGGMPKIFPCYSAVDRELARELAAFLERGGGVEVLLEEGEMQAGDDLISKVEEGLSADVVLALLSPAAVPDRWIRERWQSVFWEQAAEVGTPVATLLCQDSKFPDLLRRKNFFDLRQNRLAGLRATRRWLMSLWPAPQQAPFIPARLPAFTGREAELETLCTMLADAPGMAVVTNAAAGSGKTALALEFARRYREDFDAVLWLTCGARSAAALAGDLAAQLGARLDRDLESNLHELRSLCARHRCLLVVDDAVASTAAVLAPRGRTSVLLTTRRDDLAAALSAAPLPIESRNAGAAGDAVSCLDNAGQHMLAAMCACAPSGFRLDIAARTAGVAPRAALDLAAHFLSLGLLTPLDENGPRFLVPSTVRDAAAALGDPACWARRHAQAVAEGFDAADWPDLQDALGGTLAASEDWSLACTLARRGVAWARAQDRLAEAFEMLQDWRCAAEERADRRVLEDCAWEQMWILDRWGREQEARELDTIRRKHYTDQLPLDFGEEL